MDVKIKTAYFRFYEELNDYLPADRRKTEFRHTFIDRTTVKDMISSLGVPHQQIDLILVNGQSVDFSYRVDNGDRISVYPVFESLDISSVTHLRKAPLREPKFILDVHLGRLASYMRMLGFDTLYSSSYEDIEIVSIALSEKRTILTRDLGILKRNDVTHGHWVRNTHTAHQLIEILDRFDLRNSIAAFTRCLVCNHLLQPVDKSVVAAQLPEKSAELYSGFSKCPSCGRIYWKGSHYENMRNFFKNIVGIDI